MAIVRMKKLKLMVVTSQSEAMLRELMLIGCVEISEPISQPGGFLAGLKQCDSGDLAKCRLDHAALKSSLNILDKYAPEKSTLLSQMPEVTQDELLDEKTLPFFLALTNKISSLDDKLKKLASEESRIRAHVEALLPWEGLDLPLEYTETEISAVIKASLPAATDFAAAKAALSMATEKAELFCISSDKNLSYTVLVCLKDDLEDAITALRPLGFSAMNLGDLRGTPAENISALEKALQEIAAEKKALSAQIAAETAQRAKIKLTADTLATKVERAEAASKMFSTESVSCFEGWFPADSEEALKRIFDKYDCAWETEDPDPSVQEEIPVKLRSNALTKPMTMIAEMYSLPAYGGIDPNPFLLPSFALFFGIMFGDMGYGMLLILAGLLIKFRIKARGTLGYMGGMALICGVSCIILGAMTGTFFGDIVPRVAEFFGGSAGLPSLIDPLSDPMPVLYICIGIGIVHMLVGVTINGYLLIRDGQWVDALCDAGTVYLSFAGLALGALGVTWWVAVISLAAVVLTQGRSSKTIAGKLGGGLWGLYNFVAGWFGDILSYSRLMALMLAGSVIAQVFNTLGWMTGNIITFLMVFLMGHVLNFALSLIGTYVHASRLEYLEFFGKFYREGGRAFRPLEVKTDYYIVCKK